MKTYIKNDLKRAYLVLEGVEGDAENYQIKMLKENHIPRILKTDVRYVDNQSHYYYDISGKTEFKTLHEKIHLSLRDMKVLVLDLLQAIQNLQKYMLDGNCILLEPEYIFGDGEHFYFCYCPSSTLDVKEEFHKLTEFFVREVNYKDEEGVRFAYTLHKATMEEHYSIEEIMKQFEEEVEEVEEVVEETVLLSELEDVTEPPDEEESENFWTSLKAFFVKLKNRFLDDEEDL